MSQSLYDLLSHHLTPRKKELFDRIAAERTRHVTFVLEDIYQAQNASAIFRSLESWGVQDVHIIENAHHLNVQRRVAKGAYDWLTVHRYQSEKNNTFACIENLRKKGYAIYATSLHEEAITHHQLNLSQPIAIVMGTELTGVSPIVKEHCDGFVRIPTFGFTESLNVSVAAGIIIQHVAERLRQSTTPWQLSPAEQLELKIEWAKKTISWSQHLIELYESGEIS
jgi:tRNA (guanosine-2'-O-)-methyltransferase